MVSTRYGFWACNAVMLEGVDVSSRAKWPGRNGEESASDEVWEGAERILSYLDCGRLIVVTAPFPSINVFPANKYIVSGFDSSFQIVR